MAKAKELREKSGEELAAEEASIRKTIFETSYKHAMRQLEDTASLPRLKKDLARVLTIKSQKAAQATKQEKK